MKTYELTYIITSEISSGEVEVKGKEIESAVLSKEGIILKQLNPTAKTLAFPIVKRASGFFGVMEFQIEPEKLLEVKEIIVKDEKIVRHMVLIKEPVKPRKERRSKKEETTEVKVEEKKDKVELKDIEQQLDELLG
ncbi:MAG: hypothetical protein A2528_02670 [Candidatus Staskawiczbacteria bacterium RIFOXYD2_FULL_37_9]|uniref:Small ribosomal subunit protein bS6 n=1 Tax=Candidatus Staskawiczbacteria bacterium RIFOXYB1_FULL_37_44 TaxID=1802223 RepID=A0A1G2IUG6_9BACT|nr:MAG: hypothetical protein A2358_03490 [Candidatus Staskawiczbacteria bacterium RIFOXYB1_FULL_37_44]OGZ83439.1 MAG: hypothetical protein A2416_00750 [Candidatus Staskawiczbacteria bacterium RIFOXYC1_FULL_37_52]OGZ87841.1 MAG: hypothetical protein A2444_01965 [Candidatus Staskawiczbacteria bacterium RIFOXYC2_FULL_37_19]OGZ88883.1 MAG: hypothetical protein A2581_00060 [Candidatus Staskawiczbacteria bacterium RIFOXYD1_FULL_37_110]OGZ94406.1 MAG: hypothetical protein A2528_02670 [Candidatus Stask